MSKKKNCDFKKDASFLKVENNSSMLLTGRCTSTPITTSKLSFSRLESSLGEINITRSSACSTPKMDLSNVPIFGRRNLQLLNDYKNGGELRCEEMKNLQKLIRQPFMNVEKTFGDASENDEVKPGSSDYSTNSKQVEAKRKTLKNKRKSIHNDSQVIALKVRPKLSKSPRLLTAMRAKLKNNRDKIKSNAENEELGLAKEDEKKNIYNVQKKKNRIKPTPSIKNTVYSKYKITVPKTPKLTKSKASSKM